MGNSADEEKGKIHFEPAPDCGGEHNQPVFYGCPTWDALRTEHLIDPTAIWTMRQRSVCGTAANAPVPVL